MSAGPFAVEIRLATPPLLRRPLALDGLLAWSAVDSQGPEAGEHLPLMRSGEVWHASVGILEAPAPGIEAAVTDISYIRSLRPQRDLDADLLAPGGLRARTKSAHPVIDLASGPYRNCMTAYRRHEVSAMWFAAEGDGDACLALLSLLSGIGAKAGGGHGAIADIRLHDVAATEHGRAGLVDATGRPARPIPLSLWSEIALPDADPPELSLEAPAPPYWQSGRAVLSVVPDELMPQAARREIRRRFSIAG